MKYTNKACLKRITEGYLHALSHKGFLYLWIGQAFSNIGTWMQNVALSWMVLSFTDSAFLLGLANVMQSLPALLLSLVAGAASDIFPKRRILILTSGSLSLISAAFALLIFTGAANYRYILLLSLIIGCINAFDMPARQAIVMETVGQDHLVNAVSLNSAAFNLARLLGPAAAGIVMSATGPGWCFVLNSASFLPVIAALFLMKPHMSSIHCKKEVPDGPRAVLKEIYDGLRYIKGVKTLYFTILLSGSAGFFGFNYQVLLPVITKDVFHLHERAFGFMMSSLGAGALAGAFIMSVTSKKKPRASLLLSASAMLSASLILTGFSSGIMLTAVGAAAIGFFLVVSNTASNSVLQISSDDGHRGRVMGIYSLIFSGGTPLSNFLAGILASGFGAQHTLVLSGILCLLCTVAASAAFRKG